MDTDTDEVEKHAYDVREARDTVLLDLDNLMHEIYAHGEGASTEERESSICLAIYHLGILASPETTMGTFLPSAAQFVEACELGNGNHGVVTMARDTATGETVALKTLHPKPLYYAEDDEAELYTTHRVLREACFMAACRGHPSLVNLSALDEVPDSNTGSKYCLVMEHVGPSLCDVLYHQRGCKPFAEREVRRIMRQVLSGAMAMHQRRIVHRGINVTNVHVGDGGDVKIGGYGVATSWSELDFPFAGVLSHLAPEFLADGTSDQEGLDLWSMGCLMLELLTGHEQFAVESGSGSDTLQKIEDVLGFTDKETMESVEKPVGIELSTEVQRYRVQWRGKTRLRELVPSQVLSDEGFRVLQGLLMYCPKGRIRAEDALKLPWFTRNTDDSAPPVSVSSWVCVGDDSAHPAVSVSARVCIVALALLFLVFAFLIGHS
ncbi:hypothetical protein HU200_001207 [Digitaria exilis]|uniref:[RNA-polymerase]-subunit kinase n=1 Tax=Digitaria exilis TaxID=1010633 RepID=A0A835FYS5_9POAL|nr:hypothetical protein HU200_001207 [Digitaria exilis]